MGRKPQAIYNPMNITRTSTGTTIAAIILELAKLSSSVRCNKAGVVPGRGGNGGDSGGSEDVNSGEEFVGIVTICHVFGGLTSSTVTPSALDAPDRFPTKAASLACR